ncbi:MAG: DUF6089 family protein [Bacteroidetes bacterium]|nr:DUF6089 family protein [Bacteroidota bacterium]
MNKIRIISVFLFLLMIPSLMNAQRWKRQRYEFSFGVGASNFLGELGGANQIGTHYFKDFEWDMTRFAAAAGLRFKMSNYFAFKTHLTYGRISGDDKLTTETFRNYRNLNFTSDIYEFNINFEGAFQQEQIGSRYRFRKHKGGLSGYEIYSYAFVGAGVFYFDPRTTYNGKTYRLQPLGTEGQGWDPSKAKYSLVQFCIPMGVGFKYTIGNSIGVGLEVGIRKTFTDYLDDVSTKYYNFSASKNSIIWELADRSDNDAPYNKKTYPERTAPGEQRGNSKEKDSYLFAIFSLNYKLTSGRGHLPRF